MLHWLRSLSDRLAVVRQWEARCAAGPREAPALSDDAGAEEADVPNDLEQEFACDDECEALARTLVGEAVGEAWLGKVAVAWVVRNRVERAGRWGDSYREVAFQPAQFSCFGAGPHRRRVELFPESLPAERDAVRECLEVAALVRHGRVPDPTNGATHYVSVRLYESERCPAWAREPQVRARRVGGHMVLAGVR